MLWSNGSHISMSLSESSKTYRNELAHTYSDREGMHNLFLKLRGSRNDRLDEAAHAVLSMRIRKGMHAYPRKQFCHEMAALKGNGYTFERGNSELF